MVRAPPTAKMAITVVLFRRAVEAEGQVEPSLYHPLGARSRHESAISSDRLAESGNDTMFACFVEHFMGEHEVIPFQQWLPSEILNGKVHPLALFNKPVQCFD